MGHFCCMDWQDPPLPPAEPMMIVWPEEPPLPPPEPPLQQHPDEPPPEPPELTMIFWPDPPLLLLYPPPMP